MLNATEHKVLICLIVALIGAGLVQLIWEHHGPEIRGWAGRFWARHRHGAALAVDAWRDLTPGERWGFVGVLAVGLGLYYGLLWLILGLPVPLRQAALLAIVAIHWGPSLHRLALRWSPYRWAWSKPTLARSLETREGQIWIEGRWLPVADPEFKVRQAHVQGLSASLVREIVTWHGPTWKTITVAFSPAFGHPMTSLYPAEWGLRRTHGYPELMGDPAARTDGWRFVTWLFWRLYHPAYRVLRTAYFRAWQATIYGLACQGFLDRVRLADLGNSTSPLEILRGAWKWPWQVRRGA